MWWENWEGVRQNMVLQLGAWKVVSLFWGGAVWGTFKKKGEKKILTCIWVCFNHESCGYSASVVDCMTDCLPSGIYFLFFFVIFYFLRDYLSVICRGLSCLVGLWIFSWHRLCSSPSIVTSSAIFWSISLTLMGHVAGAKSFIHPTQHEPTPY